MSAKNKISLENEVIKLSTTDELKRLSETYEITEATIKEASVH